MLYVDACPPFICASRKGKSIQHVKDGEKKVDNNLFVGTVLMDLNYLTTWLQLKWQPLVYKMKASD